MGYDRSFVEKTLFLYLKGRLFRLVEEAGSMTVAPSRGTMELRLEEIFRLGGTEAVKEAIKDAPSEVDEDFPDKWNKLYWAVNAVYVRLAQGRQSAKEAPSPVRKEPEIAGRNENGGLNSRRTVIEEGYELFDGPLDAPVDEPPKKPERKTAPEKKRPREIVIINDDIL